MSERKLLITKIHIAKSQLGLDDDIYRVVLADTTNGKTSCSKMNITELRAVMATMKERGFKAKKPAESTKRLSPKSGNARFAEIDKIVSIWITMSKQGFVRDGSETALDIWVERVTAKWKKQNGTGIRSVRWLGRDATKVLEALKGFHRREMCKQMQRPDLSKAGYSTVCQAFEQTDGGKMND